MQRLDLKNITKKTNGIILIPVSWYCWLTIFVMHSSYSICPQILELKLIKIFLHTPHNNCQSFYCCCTNIILNHTIKLNIVKSHAVLLELFTASNTQTVISNPSSRCHHWKAVKILFGKIYDSVFLSFCPLLFLL